MIWSMLAKELIHGTLDAVLDLRSDLFFLHDFLGPKTEKPCPNVRKFQNGREKILCLVKEWCKMFWKACD